MRFAGQTGTLKLVCWSSLLRTWVREDFIGAISPCGAFYMYVIFMYILWVPFRVCMNILFTLIQFHWPSIFLKMQVRKRRRQCFTHNSHASSSILFWKSWMHELCLAIIRLTKKICTEWNNNLCVDWMKAANCWISKPFWMNWGKVDFSRLRSWICLIGHILWVSGNDWSRGWIYMLETDLILGSFLPHSEFDGVIYLLLVKLNSCKRRRSRRHLQKVEKFRWWFVL